MSKKLDDIFEMEYSHVEYSEYDPSEKISGGWNDCPEFRKAVSEGMIEMWSTDAGKVLLKSKALVQRNISERYITNGFLNKSHTDETKIKIGNARRGKKLSNEDKTYIKNNYLSGIGIKTIAKNIGFSHTAVRKFLKTRGIK
jgi:hypothetical protein